jgi:hypothetical protein
MMGIYDVSLRDTGLGAKKGGKHFIDRVMEQKNPRYKPFKIASGKQKTES